MVIQMDAGGRYGRTGSAGHGRRGRGDRQPLRARRLGGRELGLPPAAALAVGQPPGALDRRPETGARLHRRHQGDPDSPRCEPPGWKRSACSATPSRWRCCTACCRTTAPTTASRRWSRSDALSIGAGRERQHRPRTATPDWCDESLNVTAALDVLWEPPGGRLAMLVRRR